VVWGGGDSGGATTWINRDGARAIIDHLEKVLARS
jgi:hypothetical protein